MSSTDASVNTGSSPQIWMERAEVTRSPRISIERPKRWDKPFSDEMTDEDVERLLTIPPFSELDEKNFTRKTPLRGILKNETRIVRCEKGDIIVREGDWSNSAFFIVSGSVRVELEPPGHFPAKILGRREVKRKNLFQTIAQLWSNHSEPEYRNVSDSLEGIGSRGSGQNTRIYLQEVGAVLDKYHTVRLEAGQFFGEIAALGRTPRVATVFADGTTELLEIRWQGFRELLRDDRLKQHIDDIFRKRVLSGFFLTVPMFHHLQEAEMDDLVNGAEFETYGTYESAQPFSELAASGSADVMQEPVVAEEGHYPNGVILVRSGLARLSRRHHNGHRTVGYLTPGQTYGFEEIAESFGLSARDPENGPVPLKLSLRAIGYLTVVVVPTPLIERFVLRDSRSAYAQQKSSQPDRASPSSSAPDLKLDNNLLEFLVQRRYVQGTATMVIDMDRCTRCDDCVRACATTHDNNPRFVRHGPIHNQYMIANACMHCADPVCMIECPTGAIHRDLLQGNVVINEDTCIGCTTCANNCPYDAIRMVEIRNVEGKFIRDQETNRPLLQATKCDLCVDQLGGPACARACPHDALTRVDLRNLVSVGEAEKP